MTDVSPLIDAMGLAPHPEGGHYRRTWTAPARVDTPRGSRHSASAIIFLLDHDEEARWHLVHSDELWIWSGPGALEVHLGGSAPSPAATTRWPPASSPPSSPSTTGSSPREPKPDGTMFRGSDAQGTIAPLGALNVRAPRFRHRVKPPARLIRAARSKEETWVWKI